MTEAQPRVELYVRSLAPTDGRAEQERVVRLLRDLEASGRIAEFELVVCGDCVCPSLLTAQTDLGRRLLGRYREFEQWAEQRGRRLVGFEHRHVDSELRDDSVTAIHFPRLALAEYRDRDLTFVAPSRTDGTASTVTGRLQQY
jgi:hypothetical protein